MQLFSDASGFNVGRSAILVRPRYRGATAARANIGNSQIQDCRTKLRGLR
jgi:hypothetical protein